MGTVLFTGREWITELGLYDYRNRIYSSELGRFLQTDPIRFDAGDVNLCRYVSNNPINLVDPDGLQPGRRGGRRNNGSAWNDFKDQYDKMREANWKNSDKYFHCMANCEAAKKGHSKGAKQLSDMREWFDEHIKGDSKADCDADQEANKHGRDAGEKGEDCKSACDKYRPNGLPDKY
jgi:RHS repeat-associated protein